MPSASINFQTPISDAWIATPSAGQGIAANKLIHYFPRDVTVADPLTTIAAATKWLHTVQGSYGKIVALEATLYGLPTGNYTVTVDVQRGRAGGSFNSVLTGTSTFNASSTDLEPQSLSLAAAYQALETGDILIVIVTVAGSSGAQGTGLFISGAFEESET